MISTSRNHYNVKPNYLLSECFYNIDVVANMHVMDFAMSRQSLLRWSSSCHPITQPLPLITGHSGQELIYREPERLEPILYRVSGTLPGLNYCTVFDFFCGAFFQHLSPCGKYISIRSELQSKCVVMTQQWQPKDQQSSLIRTRTDPSTARARA